MLSLHAATAALRVEVVPDVLVIFGAAVQSDGSPSGTLRRRVEAALETAAGSRDARFLPTGAVGRHGPAEAEVMSRLLIAAGVPEAHIVEEREGTDTLSSIVNCAKILEGRKAEVGAVVVCTSRYHVPRCRWLFYLLGVRASAGRVPRDYGLLPTRKLAYSYFRELPALLLDSCLVAGRLLLGRTARLKIPG